MSKCRPRRTGDDVPVIKIPTVRKLALVATVAMTLVLAAGPSVASSSTTSTPPIRYILRPATVQGSASSVSDHVPDPLRSLETCGPSGVREAASRVARRGCS